MTAVQQAPTDQTAVEAFVGKVLTDTSSAMITTLAGIGDRLGLWRDLADHGPATSAELAARAGIQERYAREWLSAMSAHGYLTYEPETGEYTLPAAHAPALADDGGPMFFGGVHQMLLGTSGAIDAITEAFRSGGGAAQSAYGPDWWQGMERFTSGWFDNLLLPIWIPAMPDVEAALTRGVEVADVGCGRGRALIRLAEAFPDSRYTGYDVFGPAITAARVNAEAAGVADRVRFEQRDVAAGLPPSYDVITTFDVIHDAVDPRGLLRAIRTALRPGGRYVCLDMNASHRVEDNAGPLGAMFYGFSVLYCMTTSLAAGGEGLGTCGFNPQTVDELCAEAGFDTVRRVPLENPFNILYEIAV